MDKKVAIVTGASRGIGAEIAKTLATDGMDVVITYAGNEQKALDVKAEIEAQTDAKVMVSQLDVADENSIKQMVDNVKNEFGKIDVLVNNAGITNDMLVMQMKKQDFTDVINTNLIGTFQVTQAVLKVMARKRQGSIINLSSVIGITGNIGQANYAASKAGIMAFTKSVAKEYGRRNIRVNCVAPGFIQTDMTESLPEEYKKEVLSKIPLNRLGEAKEVADLVSFLASDKSKYITSQSFVIDGGMI